MDLRFQIRRAMETGKVLLGYRESEKSLMNGRAKLIILASNAPREEAYRIQYLAKVGSVPLYRFPGTTIELGQVCGKPFAVSVLAVEDAGDSSILDLAKEE
ncbi:MAG: large subunit ribosomal protein L30e [Candidatus Diapherotrites archaeon]|nr:large subunit ribosomal protein L30e [Candidatus Diapherotrites archaeon]